MIKPPHFPVERAPSPARSPQAPLAARTDGPQSGYALLLVFCMSAILAIELYQQLPRAAFESQREKESLLINHGEQYIRGVQLYVRKMGRYPAKMEDLDNTQNIRFLRKHYIDPMTGREEWRLLHMGPAGKLIDSKIETPDANKDQWHQGSITEFKSAASSDGGPEAINLASRHRASDDNMLGPMGGTPPPSAPPDPNNPNANNPNANNPNANNPNPSANNRPLGSPGNVNPSAPGYLTGASPLPGMPGNMRGAMIPQGQAPQPPSNNSANSNGGFGGGGSVSGNGGYGSSVSGNGGYGTPSPSPQPGTPPTPGYGQPVNSQYQGQSPYSTSGPQGGFNQTGFNQPGTQPGTPNGFLGPNGPNSSPAQMINNLLTQPRPGGAPSGALPGMGGSVVGGLAGVASTYKGHGIRRYNDQDEYQKWEFFYDFGAESRNAQGVAQPQTIGPNNGQTNSPQQPGNGFSNSQQSGGGFSGGFGNSQQSGSGFSGGFSSPQQPSSQPVQQPR